MQMHHVSVNWSSDKPYIIMPLGDIQWTGEKKDVACRILEERIETGLELGAMFIGMGDYIDYASPSNRAALRGTKLYDNARAVHDRAARSLVDELYDKYLHKTKGRWLGLLEGHHFAELETGITTDQYLCEKLQTVHLGSCAYVGIHFNIGSRQGGVVNIWAHHGQGNGQSTGAPIVKLEKMLPDFEADIFLIGHMTKQASAPANRVYPVWGKQGQPHKLKHITKVLVGTGGFGKGYIENSHQGQVPRGTYVEQGMMRPATLGSPIIRVTPKMLDKYVGGTRLSWFAPKITVELGG